METATQEIIFQIITIVIGIGLTAISVYLKNLIKTKIDVTKYGFENERIERLLDNAIMYAEGKAREQAKSGAMKLAGNEKLGIARKYLNNIDPEVISRYGGQIDDMLSRKVEQVIK